MRRAMADERSGGLPVPPALQGRRREVVQVDVPWRCVVDGGLLQQCMTPFADELGEMVCGHAHRILTHHDVMAQSMLKAWQCRQWRTTRTAWPDCW